MENTNVEATQDGWITRSGTFLLERILKPVGASLISWEWTKGLLYWVIVSAGTMAECAFLIASIWMSVNSTVHPFVRLAFSEAETQHLSQLATTAYVALPECILFLSLITTINRIAVWWYKRDDYIALTWSILYAIPTIVFIALSLLTLGNSVLSTSFELPGYMIVTRALSGYMYAVIAFLYMYLGVPKERERLVQKDNEIAELTQTLEAKIAGLQQELQGNASRYAAELRQQKESFIREIEKQSREIEFQKALLQESKNVQAQLQNAVNQFNENALQAYSEECQIWLNSGVKTATIESIQQYTGHSKQKISAAILKGLLRKAPRSDKDLVLMSSLIPWLKTVQPSEKPALHIVNE